jgi:choline-sulfatase
MRFFIPLLLLASCGGSAPAGVDGIKNVVLFTFDTTRADHVGCYGNQSASTPRIDALAQTGVRFEKCFSVGPTTLPSHASILTGQYPFVHGVRNNGTHALPDSAQTLAEILQAEGFQTGAVVSAMVLNSRYGLGQGFDSYDDNLSAGPVQSSFLLRETTGDDATRRALDFLTTADDRPFFLWVHLFDPHDAYTPPAGFAERADGNLYGGEIAFADEQMGLVLDAIKKQGKLDETLVVMTADHGESLGEHGEDTHAIFIYDATTHVPLVFSHPNLQQDFALSSPVSSVDIAPTILGLLGLPKPDIMDGLSLAPIIINVNGPALDAERVIYSESMFGYYNLGWAELRGVRDHAWRYIQAPQPELYDLTADPQEIQNLWQPDGSRPVFFRQQLNQFLQNGEQNNQSTKVSDMDPDERAKLEALGYVSFAFDEETADRKDPKDGIPWMAKQKLAFASASAGNPNAEALLREVIKENPADTTSLATLARILEGQDRLADALPVRQKLASTSHAGVMEILALADLERRLGNALWENHLQMARLLGPQNPGPWIFEGNWSLTEDEFLQAEVAFEKAHQLAPQNYKPLLGMGIAQLSQQNLSAAEESFNQAKSLDPQVAEVHFQLGRVAELENNWTVAARHFGQCVKLDAKHADVLYRFGSALLRNKNFPRAAKVLQRLVERGDAPSGAYLNLGILAAMQSKSTEAEEYFKQAVTAAKATGDKATLAAALLQLEKLLP